MQDGHKTHDGSGNINRLLHHIRPDGRLQAALQRVEKRQRGHDGDRHQVALKIAHARQQAAQRHAHHDSHRKYAHAFSGRPRNQKYSGGQRTQPLPEAPFDQLISRDQLAAKILRDEHKLTTTRPMR